MPEGVEVIRVVTKADLSHHNAPGALAVSATTGLGMGELRTRLAEAAARLTDTKGAAALARPRQIACVRDTAAALDAGLGRGGAGAARRGIAGGGA